MSARVYIAVPFHGRKAIAEQCVPTIRVGMGLGDHLAGFFDGMPDDYATSFIASLKLDSLVIEQKPIGIERQRALHFRMFDSFKEFSHLYLSDADALHDPDWLTYALGIQQQYGERPVCLYNTQAHARLVGNTIEDNPMKSVIVRRVAPGISYLLTRAHCERVVKALPQLPLHWNWDWTVPSLLGHEMLVTRTSFVDHIGVGGMHHPASEGYDGGDRATNPTGWLVKKRAEVVAKLKANDPANNH